MNKRSDGKQKRRFLRGAQVVDTGKLAAAEERKRLRKQAKTRQGRAKAARLTQLAFGMGALVLFVIFMISRLFITNVSANEPAIEDYARNHVRQWPHQIKPFAASDELEREIIEMFPTVESADVTTSLFSNTLSVEIGSRQAAAYWIDDLRGDTYFIDDNAVIFEETTGMSEDLIIIRDESGLEVELGALPVSRSTLSYLLSSVNGLSELGFDVDSLRLSSEPLSFEVELRNRAYRLILSTARPLDEQLQDVEEFMTSKQGSNISRYADFRTSDKVFYR